MPAKYVSPDVNSTLTPDEIRQRYRDTAFVIFKEQYLGREQRLRESKRERAYTNFEVRQRTMVYSNYGNEPIAMNRNLRDATPQENHNRSTSSISSRFLRIYRKPRENCTIS